MQPAGFQRRVLNWYRRHGRDLPWRRTRDPYAIAVSEFMLQQTQVATVLPFYDKWLARFPNIDTLATASPNDVLHAWQGLGYYSRARNLHRLAQTVRDRHGGIFPTKPDEIRALPGVGRYTANAITTFAFDRPVPIVEANTARLLARLFNVRQPIDSASGRDILWKRAAELVPAKNAMRFNSALIDLGATVCVSRAPRCGVCPVRSFCRTPNPEVLPRKRARPATVALIESHEFVKRRDRLFLVQCSRRWRGMWMLPPRRRRLQNAAPIYTSVFPFTHHQVALRVFAGAAPPNTRADAGRWFSREELGRIPMPSPHRRAIEQLFGAP